MFILSFDIAEIYKYMLEMYNSVLDLNFFGNTIKPILYCYGIIQYLNLVQHGLLKSMNLYSQPAEGITQLLYVWNIVTDGQNLLSCIQSSLNINLESTTTDITNKPL